MGVAISVRCGLLGCVQTGSYVSAVSIAHSTFWCKVWKPVLQRRGGIMNGFVRRETRPCRLWNEFFDLRGTRW